MPQVAGFDAIRPDMTKKIFYSHHIWKYNTEIERFEMDVIDSAIANCSLINPKDFIDQNKPESEMMRDCLIAISGCDALVFSDVSGMVGKGVLTEIQFAQAIGIPVYRIVANRLVEVKDNVRYKLLNTGSDRIYAEIIAEEMV